MMRSGKTNILVYALIGALIVGLAGFGITDVLSGGSNTNVATVGDSKVTQQEYSRALNQAVNRFSQQVGQPITMEQARMFGLDGSTLSQLVTSRALENEAAQRAVMADDDMLRASIMSTPSFANTTGQFDSDAYSYALQNANYTVRAYEALIRAELSRNLLNAAVTGGAVSDGTGAAVIGQFLNESYSVDWVQINLATIPEPAAPSEADLLAWHEANAADYTLPEQRNLAVAMLSRASVEAAAGITDEAIAAEYEARLAQFSQPERRALDRLTFANAQAATAALDRVTAGDASFDDLVAERGIDPSLISLGIVQAESLNAAARDIVFGTDTLGVVGPVETDLGPALFRINAIVAASSTPLADVADDIRAQLAEPFVRERLADVYGRAEELVAAGATLEELADETGMVFDTLEFSTASSEGLAGDATFRAEALAAAQGQERDLLEADDGSLFVLRVDTITPPQLQPLADVRQEVAAAWAADAHRAALAARANSLASQINSGAAFLPVMDALGLTVSNAPGLTRGTPSEALPSAAANAAFDLAEGEAAAVANSDDSYIVLRISSITQAESGSYADYIGQRSAADEAGLASDLFFYFAAAVRDSTEIRVNNALIEAVVNGVQ
ncbi:MAG: SurA N-terminal domain-containing protein [Paracoccaceae bacterium]